MKKTIIGSVLGLSIILCGAFLLGISMNRDQEVKDIKEEQGNITIMNGKQVVDITAKGGFSPRHSTAQAGLPTVIRFDTKGTFDCSSSIRIPSMNITKDLPSSGVTDIDLGSPKVGVLQGTCGMGMYPFEIEFKG